jgi:hypothetical protein
MDFRLNGAPVGTGASEVQLGAPGSVHAQVKVAAYLDPLPDPSIRGKRYNEKPYWDVERARIGDTREVPVELIVNGEAVARKNVPADGQVRDVAFDWAIARRAVGWQCGYCRRRTPIRFSCWLGGNLCAHRGAARNGASQR